MNNLKEQSLANIVTNHFQAAQVFEKFNLDFCCKGKQTLAVACEDNGVLIEQVLTELDQVLQQNKQVKDFNNMNVEALISYIILHHHFYVKQSLPIILSHIEKVSFKHGSSYPYMIEVLNIFEQVNEEMLSHMQKEEMILFPRIRAMESALTFSANSSMNKMEIEQPIKIMEAEHEFVGEALSKIRNLTNNYTILDEMCTTFKITIAELKEFEEKLHEHVHLENNILFPKAKKMFNEVIV